MGMLTSAEIARSRVTTEDTQKQEARVARYQREIDEALGTITKAREADQLSATLLFSCGPGYDEAKRVREALIELEYDCGEIEGRDGHWTNGVGYQRYLALEVRWGEKSH